MTATVKCFTCSLPLSDESPQIECDACIAEQGAAKCCYPELTGDLCENCEAEYWEMRAEQGLDTAVETLGITRVLARLLSICEERRGYRITASDQVFAAVAESLRGLAGVGR